MPSGHRRTTLSGYIFVIRKKLVKQQYLPHMSSQYGELRPTSGWDRFGCLGHPSEFQQVSRLGSVTAATSLNGSQPNFARSLALSWAGTLYIHFRGILPRNGILPGAKFTLRPSLALSYIDSVIARHSSRGVSQTVRRWAPSIFGRAAITLSLAHILVLSFTSPIFSRRRLDVCHTSTHGMALVRI